MFIFPTTNMNSMRRRGRIPTAGEVFPDGFLEPIRNEEEWSAIQLLRYEAGESYIAAEQQYGEQRYVAGENVERIRHLPSDLAPYESTRVIFDQQCEFIFNALGAPQDFCSLLTYFVFVSFFCDCLNMAPCLLLSTPNVLDGLSVLRLLSCVCFHPVLLASISATPPELKRITRLLCQVDSALDSLLPGLQFPGFLEKGLRQISGATAVLLDDAELESQFMDTCLMLTVPPLEKSLSTDEERDQAGAIQQLQNRMLTYRLENFAKVQGTHFDAPDLSCTTRELARVFAKCIVGEPDLQKQIVHFLRSRSDADQVQAAAKLESIIVEALLVHCHERRISVHVAEITKLANAILSREDEIVTLKERAVGAKLKKLGFPTTQLDSAGRGLLLLNNECARIHQLGRSLGVASLRTPPPGCPYCNQQ